MSDVLYNGIKLDETWPPKNEKYQNKSYNSPVPKVIPINVGRQLFIDDFLIEKTDCKRIYYKPEVNPSNPIFTPVTIEELDNGDCPMAAPFNDGLWFDSKDKKYKMWYMPGWFHTTALAESEDGIHWKRPNYDVKDNTNIVYRKRKGYERDGSLVWIDSECERQETRYKMFQFFRYYSPDGREQEIGTLQVSSDGIHWNNPVITTPVGDNSSFFFNPFRRKWIMSIRRNVPLNDISNKELPIGKRERFYHENDSFLEGAVWDSSDEVMWQNTDNLDYPDPLFPNHHVALYDVNAVAYESIMIGLFGIFRGPENNICQEMGRPKLIDLEIGFSRDGFHFLRPDRTPFLAASRKEGNWDFGYLHAVGGLCCVFKDKIRFYYTGFSGKSPKLKGNMMGEEGRSRNAMYAGASVGFADLRRDGFVSMMPEKKTGSLLTRKMVFSKGNYLFVNMKCKPLGNFRVEIIDSNGDVVKGYEKENCIALVGDAVKEIVQWKDGGSISKLQGKSIRLNFSLNDCELFSFWIADTEEGNSKGYLSAGSCDYSSYKDI